MNSEERYNLLKDVLAAVSLLGNLQGSECER